MKHGHFEFNSSKLISHSQVTHYVEKYSNLAFQNEPLCVRHLVILKAYVRNVDVCHFHCERLCLHLHPTILY